jgi:hypothetical protein
MALSKTQKLLWYKAKELTEIEDGIHKTKNALGESKIYEIIERLDGRCIMIDENFIRKIRICMTKDTVDILNEKELKVYYEFSQYMSDNEAEVDTATDILEAISRELYSIYLGLPANRCGQDTVTIEDTTENTYGSDKNDKRVYFITTIVE